MNAVVAVAKSVGSTKVGQWAIKRAPQLLLTTGLISGAGALVSTVHATKRTIDMIDAEKTKRAQALGVTKDQIVLTKQEIVQIGWKNYIVPAGMAAGSAAACIGALHVEHGRALSLAALLGASESRLASMEAAIKEKLTEQKATEVIESADQKDINKTAPVAEESRPVVNDAWGDGIYTIYDPITKLKKKGTRDRVDLAVVNSDHVLQTAIAEGRPEDGVVSVADFLEDVGFSYYDIPPTARNLIWRANNTTNIGVRVGTGSDPDTGEPCYIIEYSRIRPKWEDLVDLS